MFPTLEAICMVGLMMCLHVTCKNSASTSHFREDFHEVKWGIARRIIVSPPGQEAPRGTEG